MNLRLVMDCYSCWVMVRRASISLHVQFCQDAVQKALEHYGTSEIFKAEGGRQPQDNVYFSASTLPTVVK